MHKWLENCQQKVNNNKSSLAHFYKCNFFIDKEKKEKSANLRKSLPFYGMIKSQHPCKGMAMATIPKTVFKAYNNPSLLNFHLTSKRFDL